MDETCGEARTYTIDGNVILKVQLAPKALARIMMNIAVVLPAILPGQSIGTTLAFQAGRGRFGGQ